MMLLRGEYRGRRILSETAWEAMRRDNTEGVRRFDCPVSEDECRPFWTGAVGFLVGNPDQDHFSYGLGNWLFRTDDMGRGILMSSPGAWGTHGWIDTERMYRGLLTMDGNYNEGKAIFDDILALLDTAISP